MSRTPELASFDEWMETAVDYFSNAFPNPKRTGCPAPEIVRSVAASADVIAGDVRTHLFQCSECFKDFHAARVAHAQSAPRESTRALRTDAPVRAILATAAAIIVIIGVGVLFRGGFEQLSRPYDFSGGRSASRAAGTGAQPNYAPESHTGTADESTKRVRIQLQPSTVRRGTAQSIEEAAPSIAIQPGRLRFEIELPEDYPEGVYRIAIVTPFDEVLIDATSVAAGRVVSASVNGSHIQAGRVLLRVEHVGQPPDYIPIVVGQP